VRVYDLVSGVEPSKAKKETSVRDKVKAAKQQPPTQPQRREGSKKNYDKVDLDNMTDEEFDALPPSVLARLRGDII
jgi:hypothetical protein